MKNTINKIKEAFKVIFARPMEPFDVLVLIMAFLALIMGTLSLGFVIYYMVIHYGH